MTDEFNLAVSRAGLGLIEAFARFNVSRNAQLYEHTAISATEAAMWIVALDDLHLRWLPDVADYRARRDCDEDGRVVRGITWARNEGVHALIFRHEWTDEPGLIFSAGEGRDAGINFSVGEGRRSSQGYELGRASSPPACSASRWHPHRWIKFSNRRRRRSDSLDVCG